MSIELGSVWIGSVQPKLVVEVFHTSPEMVCSKLLSDWGGYKKGHIFNHTKEVFLNAFTSNGEKNKVSEQYNKGYESGYNDCNVELHLVMSERERALQEEAWEQGFLAAVDELTECSEACSECDFEDVEYTHKDRFIVDFGKPMEKSEFEVWIKNQQGNSSIKPQKLGVVKEVINQEDLKLKQYNLIGINGLANAGKDTVGAILLEKLGKDWERGAFADIPKQMLNVMGVDTGDNSKDKEDPYYEISVREMMQTIGTKWGRGLDKNIWIKAFSKINPVGNYVMTDVRFDNEADFIRNNGGVVIHVKGRGGIESDCESEKGIEMKRGDLILYNDSDYDTLVKEVCELLEYKVEV